MDRTTSRFDAETNAQPSTKVSSRHRSNRAMGKANRARRVAYETFAVAMRGELQPKSMLETIYVNRAILSAWRLAEAIEVEQAGILGGMGVDSRDIFDRLTDDLHRQADRAERSLRRALDSLKEVRTPAWGQAITLDTKVVPVEPEFCADSEILPNEWTIVPAEDNGAEPVADDDAPLPRWQDRLVFDSNVSDQSPVIKGTWITVSQIITRIVDGFTWADILRSHPELTEEDIRICLSYATEQENGEAKGAYLP